MSSEKGFAPSAKLQTKFFCTLALVFALGFLPWVLLGFIPELGLTFVWIYVLANAVWVGVAAVLVPPYYRSIRYELTEDEIIVRKGILTKTENIVPYRTITNVSIKRDLFDRWLGMGGLQIHTAGYSQQTNAEANLAGLEDYREVHASIMDALRRYRGDSGPSVAMASANLERRDTTQLLAEILAEVKALRSKS